MEWYLEDYLNVFYRYVKMEMYRTVYVFLTYVRICSTYCTYSVNRSASFTYWWNYRFPVQSLADRSNQNWDWIPFPKLLKGEWKSNEERKKESESELISYSKIEIPKSSSFTEHEPTINLHFSQRDLISSQATISKILQRNKPSFVQTVLLKTYATNFLKVDIFNVFLYS